MVLTLKDGVKKEYDAPLSAFEVAKSISEGLARVACAAKIDGVVCDLRTVISKDSEVEILTFKDEEGRSAYRHTTSHVLAQAVKTIYPTAKLAIGPSIENGFYYDFDFKSPITTADLANIEAEMSKIIKSDLPLEVFELPKDKAIEFMTKLDEPFKVELIEELPEGEKITFYKQGDFTDLCRGPHLMSTGKIKAFKLLSITGAYWRGNEKNKMLTRIYATAFDSKAELEEYVKKVEEAKLRDHNKLGRDLKIFMTEDIIGQGLPLLMPNGARIIQKLQRFVEDEEERRGYLLTKTPLMAKSDLYKLSGHWYNYRDKMFLLGDENDPDCLALRPMTCPFQYMIYKSEIRSYRDLPLRYGETSTLFRNENSGEMHGLIRVRQFTISEGHLMCRPDQLEDEFRAVLELIYYFLDCLGLRDDVTFRFSQWDVNDRAHYIGTDESWQRSQAEMKRILDDLKIKYTIGIGEAAFYGPKLDIQTKNVYGKEDTIITVQIDLELAKKFDMTYVDADGSKKYPYIIHRTSIGCYERTLAMLIEKYAGALPLWIMPTQVKVLSLTDRTAENANQIVKVLRDSGIKAVADNRPEKLGYKIREAQLEKVPYMVVIGDKDVENGVVSVRNRKNGDLGTMTLDAFVAKVSKEINEMDKNV